MSHSPSYEYTRERLEKEFSKLEKSKITPWAYLNTEKGVNLKDADGNLVSYAGVAFTGTPREFFWNSFIQPFLHEIISNGFADTRAFCDSNSIDRSLPINETATLLRAGVHRIFDRMVDIDQMLRGEGDHESVAAFQPDEQISALEQAIADREEAELKLPAPKDELTRVGRWIRTIKDHPIVSVTIVIGVIVIALGNFTDAISSLMEPFRGDSGTQEPVPAIRNEALTSDGSDTGVVIADSRTGGNRVQKDNKLHFDLTFTPVIEKHANGTWKVFIKVNGKMNITGHMANTDVDGYFQNQIVFPRSGPLTIENASNVAFADPAFAQPVQIKGAVPGPEDGEHVEAGNRFLDTLEIGGMHEFQAFFNEIELKITERPNEPGG
mgnify:CR=1 FL=1